MSEQRDLFSPQGISRAQLHQLERLAEEVRACSIVELQQRAREHVEQARLAQARNSFVNVRFAEAIADKFEAVILNWDGLTPNSQYWFRGAIQYFIHSDDAEPDFASVIGFEDDGEVLNACLRMIGRGDWQLNPEDFDHV